MRPIELYGKIPDAIAYTERGFAIGRFLDCYGRKCSIQKSSLAEEDCIWLGSDEGSGDRMHLTQEMVADLLPILKRFVETGELTSPSPAEEG